MPCVELGDGRLLDESNSTAWLLSPESMLGGGDKTAQAEVTHCQGFALYFFAMSSFLFFVLFLSFTDSDDIGG